MAHTTRQRCLVTAGLIACLLFLAGAAGCGLQLAWDSPPIEPSYQTESSDAAFATAPLNSKVYLMIDGAGGD